MTDFGIFNLMGCRDPGKTAVQVFVEAAGQTPLADEIVWARPAHLFFNIRRVDFPAKAAPRLIESFMAEIRPLLERAHGRIGAH